MNPKKIAFLAVATIALISINLYEFAFGLNKVHAHSLPKLSSVKI